MSDDRLPAHRSSRTEIEAFLRRADAVAHAGPAAGARLAFALDATRSREPTWREAQRLQAGMFEEAAASGGLGVQLVWYRGLGEFSASEWMADAASLGRRMLDVTCEAGRTQVGRVLAHAAAEAARARLAALVFVGDAFEEESEPVMRAAGEMALRGVPALMFQEGSDATAHAAFAHIARITRGAHCPFDASSPQRLRDLLRAAAAFAAGGRAALAALARRRGGAARELAAVLQALPGPEMDGHGRGDHGRGR